LVIGINAAMFLAMVVTARTLPDRFQHWNSNLDSFVLAGHHWGIIIALFLHAGIFHLVFNMLCLFWLGRLLERICGPFITTAIYLVGGFSASRFSLIWHPHQVSVGASGAIFCTAGVLITVLSDKKLKLAKKQAILTCVIVLVVYGLIAGLMPRIDNTAHLSGLILGILFGLILALTLRSGSPRTNFLAAATLYMAQEAVERRDYNSAIDYLRDYLAARPKDARGHALLGYTLDLLGDYEEAAAEYKEVLTLVPRDSITEVNLACLLVRKGALGEALNLVQKRNTPAASSFN
jgi:rhomboid protease GluP